VHIDFTFHFWTVLSQLIALGGGGRILWKSYVHFRDFVDACTSIVREHHEMWGWYQLVKDKIK
jgi:hypothetical protein